MRDILNPDRVADYRLAFYLNYGPFVWTLGKFLFWLFLARNFVSNDKVLSLSKKYHDPTRFCIGTENSMVDSDFIDPDPKFWITDLDPDPNYWSKIQRNLKKHILLWP